MITPRLWQNNFLNKLRNAKDGFLLVAVPGAGKTFAAILGYDTLREAAIMMGERDYDLIVVVTPGDGLVDQWSVAASKLNIELCVNRKPERDFSRSGFAGMVTTYAHLAQNQEEYRNLVDSHRVLVVMDECHHMAVNSKWGQAAEFAFSNAVFWLNTSGTPFRTDGWEIPRVSYDESNKCVPDFIYPYDQAVRDKVCRTTQFFAYDSRVRYRRWLRSSDYKILDSQDDLSKAQEDEWFRAFNADYYGAVKDMFEEADAHLCKQRAETNYPYGGLLIAKDAVAARELQTMVMSVTGRMPALVISEDGPEARKARDGFANSDDMWVIAIGMVSEGIDIPRISTIVYAGSEKTFMKFVQIAGRAQRVISGLAGDHRTTAAFFMPAHRDLLRFANDIENPIAHAIVNPIPTPPEEGTRKPSSEPRINDFESEGGSSQLKEVILRDNVSVPGEVFNYARALLSNSKAKVEPAELAVLLAEGRLQTPGNFNVQPLEQERVKTLNEQENELKRDIDRIYKILGEAAVNWIIEKIMGEKPNSDLIAKVSKRFYPIYGARLASKFNPISNSSIEDLRHRLHFLRDVANALNNDKSNSHQVINDFVFAGLEFTNDIVIEIVNKSRK